jgi:hypothetical protein
MPRVRLEHTGLQGLETFEYPIDTLDRSGAKLAFRFETRFELRDAVLSIDELGEKFFTLGTSALVIFEQLLHRRFEAFEIESISRR